MTIPLEVEQYLALPENVGCEFVLTATLDAKGRCCGRKPLVYKRDATLFCHRCSRAYTLDGEQKPSYCFVPTVGGWIKFRHHSYGHPQPPRPVTVA